MKSRGGKSQRREDKKKEDPGARKGRKVAKHCVFQWFVAPGGRKVGSLKRRVRSQLARWEMKNCTLLWREAHVQVKKLENIVRWAHFWKLRCLKSARRCGAKHISKSTCKHEGFGPLLEVQMSFRVAGARDCAPCQKWAKREGFVALSTTTTTTPHCTPTHYTATTTTPSLHSTTLHYTTLHYTTTTLHYMPLHYTPLHSITLNYTTLNYTTLHYIPLHSATLHSITLHYTTLHYIPLHSTTLH